MNITTNVASSNNALGERYTSYDMFISGLRQISGFHRELLFHPLKVNDTHILTEVVGLYFIIITLLSVVYFVSKQKWLSEKVNSKKLE